MANEYWRTREEQALAEYQLTDDEYVKQLNDIYDYMVDQINREIRGFYSKYADAEGITMAEAAKRASELDMDEYSRKAKKYVAEKDFSAQANREMRLYNMTMKVNRLELLKSNIGLEMVDGFQDIEDLFGDSLTERAMDEFRRQAGILGNTVHDSAKNAKSIVGASFHNANWSDRIWMYQGMLRDELSTLLTQGMIQGRNPNELARHINNLFDAGKYNCERLMRTEMTRVQSDAQLQSFIANGFDEYQFNALGDACPDCKALDEQHFKIMDAEPGENLPPIHPNCRCAVSAWMDDESYNEWLDSYKDHGMDYQDWLENRPTAVDSTKVGRNYDCELALALGKEQYDRLIDMVDGCDNENIKKMWDKYHDQVTVAETNGDRMFTVGSEVHLNLQQALDGTAWLAPSEAIFHEATHAIDGLANNDALKSGQFAETIQSEVGALINNRAEQIKQDWDAHAGDWEYLAEKQYIASGSYKYYQTTGKWLNDEEPTYSENMAYSAISLELRGLDKITSANLSDVLEGATAGKILTQVGHGYDYWNKEGISIERRLAAEAFAEMSASSIANTESLALLREWLPESYGAWLDIVEEVAQ